MISCLRNLIAGLVAVGPLIGTASVQAEGWKAGTARVVITPQQPTWMAGYAARTEPSQGTIHDLWAKALVIEDPGANRVALVTLDLCGIDRELSLAIRDAVKDRHGLDRQQVALACSHTHSGPVVGTNLIDMYPLDEEQKRRIEDYSQWLGGAVVDLVGEAIEAVEPAELSWGIGHADFAVNRRNNPEGQVPALRQQLALQGPEDHDVPVLKVEGEDGAIRAIMCLYACHCTTLSINEFSGDYAGFAQIAIEAQHPGAQAMFVAGCGADQNPIPRRTVEEAQDYGEQLADAVQWVISGGMRPVSGRLAAAYEEIPLPFAPIPDRATFEAEAQSSNLALANRARRFLTTLDEGGSLPTTYPYPVQVWRLGDDLTWILLGGEVVVDYALRLKRNLGTSRTWVAAYCNDVMAYIPSLRVLREGGYEGATSMIYYGQPTTWAESVEEDVIASVLRLLQATPAAQPQP